MFPGPQFAQNVWRAYDDNPLTCGDCVGDPMKGVDRMNGGNPSCSNDAATVFKAAVDSGWIQMYQRRSFFDDLKNLPDAIAYAHNALVGCKLKRTCTQKHTGVLGSIAI